MSDQWRSKYLAMTMGLVSAGVASSALLVEVTQVSETLFSTKLPVIAAFGSIMAGIAGVLMFEVLRRSRARKRARRVFIIYSHRDREQAQSVAETLRSAGVEPWLDFENVAAGEVWRDVVSQAILDSAMAVVLFTKNTASSESISSELELAIKNLDSRDKVTSPIIPLLYEGGSVPDRLRHIHYVDMTSKGAEDFMVKSVEKAMDRVIQALTSEDMSKPIPSRK